MRPTLLRQATHIHSPMIHFLGKRSLIKQQPHAPAPHPSSPPEIIASFQSFLSKLQSSSHDGSASSNPKGQSLESSSKGEVHASSGKDTKPAAGKQSGPVDFEMFFEAPGYLWKTKPLTEKEIEAIMSGGATNV